MKLPSASPRSTRPVRFLSVNWFKTLSLLESVLIAWLVVSVVALAAVVLAYQSANEDLISRLEHAEVSQADLAEKLASSSSQLEKLGGEYEALKGEDQVKRNRELTDEIRNIQNTYNQAVATYEDLVKLREISQKTQTLDAMFTKALVELARRNYEMARDTLQKLAGGINTANQAAQQAAGSAPIPANVPAKNTPPDSGYSRQKVVVEGVGEFLVDVVTADLNSTRVIVDTASDQTCTNDCPVLPLATYVSRSGAYAGINGSYFCPASYPSCAGKTNSFDTLLMNKNKVYFNSENNVYSSLPAAIFFGNQARFVGASSEWGRDTGVDAVIANQPLLTQNGEIRFGGGSDPKQGSKGGRSFIGATGNKGYMGVVRSATVAEAARVVHAMGIQNALNLDSGGSTALWFSGYKAGPGRDLPNVVLFVRK